MVKELTPLHRGDYSVRHFQECSVRCKDARYWISTINQQRNKTQFWNKKKKELQEKLGLSEFKKLIDEMNRQKNALKT